MRRATGIVLLVLALGGLVWSQRDRIAPPREIATWEFRALIPLEVAPGAYKQVDWYQVTTLGEQGWELVSVTQWVLRNDEHKGDVEGQPKMVTQGYMAYYFKRPKALQQ